MASRLSKLRWLLVIAAALSLVAAVACGGADDDDEPAPAAKAEPTTAPPAGTEPKDEPAATPEEVAKVEEEGLGYVPWTVPSYGPGEVRGTFYDGPRPTKFTENPKIAQLVSAGRPCGTYHGPGVSPTVNGGAVPCPAVEDRLPVPSDVLVLQPPYEIGVYGGTKRYYTTGGQVVADLSSQGLFDGLDARAGKALDLSEDGRTYTITLRDGWKWSDGKPLDVEDFKLAWEDFNYNKELHPSGTSNPPKDGITGNSPTFDVIDAMTWSLTYDTPNVTLLGTYSFRPCWGCRGGWTMVHAPFFKQFHPKFQDADVLKAQQEYWGVDDWTKVVFRFHPEFGQAVPVLGNFATPVADWRIGWGTQCTVCPAGQDATTNPRTFANPYFGAVDPHGQQLPYLDGAQTIMVESKDVEVFRALAGESDGPRCCWGADVLPLWHDNMEGADLSVFSWVYPDGVDAMYMWQQDYITDPEWGRLVRTVDFRRAMSLAIDRQAINDGVFLGLATVQNNIPHPSALYYPGPEWASYDIGPDKDEARALFKKMGYEDKDGDGWLDRLDGTGPLELDFRNSTDEGPEYGDIGEYLKRDWEAIGVKVKLSLIKGYVTPMTDGEIALGGASDPDRDWTNNRAQWYVVRHNVSFSLKSSRYYYTGGEEGWAPTGPDPLYTDVYGNMAAEGDYPSDIQGNFLKLQDLHRQGRQLSEFDPRRIEMGKEVYRILTVNHYTFSIIGFKPNVGYVRNNVRNWLQESSSPRGYGHNNELQYFEDGIDNVNHPGNKSKKYKSWSFAL